MPKIKKQKKSSGLFLKIIIGALVAIAIIGGGYSYLQYKNSEIEESGIIICSKDGNCEQSLHIHANLEINICGENINLPKDTGPLNRTHTHKEDNLLHFHERLKVTQSGDLLDKEPLKLSTALQDILQMKLTNTCLGGNCNGDICNKKKGVVKLNVNGIDKKDIENYSWHDADKIRLTFE